MRLTRTPLTIAVAVLALAAVGNAATPPTLNASLPGITFTYAGDAKLPSALAVQVTSSGVSVPITVSVDPLQPAPWLIFTAPATAPGVISLRVNPSGLAARTYTTNVNITSTATPSTATFAVTLIVKGAPPVVTAVPDSASFTYTTGTLLPTPPKISFSVTSSAQAVSVGLKSSAPTWLKVSKDAGVAVAGAPFGFDVIIDPVAVATLTPKSYAGTITVVSSDTSVKALTIPVILNVTQGPPTISSVYPASFAVNTANATVTLSGSNYFPASIVSIGSKDVPATSVTYVSGSALLVAVPASVLAVPGTYMVTVRNGSMSSPASVLTVGTPGPQIAAVANVASYSQVAAPGSIVSIFGSGLGPVDLTPATPSGGKYPVTTADVKVQFETGGSPAWVDAPLIFVRADQINAVVPFTAGPVSPATSVNVRVTTDVSTGTPHQSAPFPVPFAATDPGVFTVNGAGSAQAIVLNQNATGAWALNGKDNAALKGTPIVIYLTGGGALSPATADGTIIVAPAAPLLPPTTSVSPVVTVGGKPCTVTYSGAVDGSIAGLVQLNCTLDSTLTKNEAAPLLLTYGSQSSQSGVTIAVRE